MANLALTAAQINDALANAPEVSVRYKQTTTAAIQSSFNVSSVDDDSTGVFTINITNAFADTDSQLVFGNYEALTTDTALLTCAPMWKTTAPATTAVPIVVAYTSNLLARTKIDVDRNQVMVMGDLA